MAKRFVSIGECMIEMSGGENKMYRQGFAGDTLNTAWYARAALPASWSVDYVTAVGDDIYSTQMLEFLSSNGIGTAAIARKKGRRPGLYMIHQEGGDRHFTYWRDTSAAKLLADDPAALRSAVAEASLVYFSGITLAILAPAARKTLFQVIGEARSSGAQTAFDPNIRPILWPDADGMKMALMEAASVSSFVLPTHSDDKPFFGDADPMATARRYLAAGASEIVVKNGADDALILTADERHVAPAQKNAKVVDATGAGDSFNGAYLSARLEGKSIPEAAAAAHRTASIVIGHKGALVDPKFLG